MFNVQELIAKAQTGLNAKGDFKSASKPLAFPKTSGSVAILGIRGIPAAHGGFETFAEKFAPWLVEQGVNVTVYCQDDDFIGTKIINRYREDIWNGVRRVHVAVSKTGPLGTMEFDLFSVLHSQHEQSVKLILGYNTAVFTSLLRFKGHAVITNMDGLEWKRQKWSKPARAWFYMNEWAAAFISTKMIADHPSIADHLASRRSRDKCVMIPYGADPVQEADALLVKKLGLTPDRYFISIARIEKENSIYEMVKAFSNEKRGMKFVVLGKFDENNDYHNSIKQIASNEVIFPGAIYDPNTVKALRFYARAYCHGHTVGGTNPSLVESLHAGNVIIAHDNRFNRYVAGPDQLYFSSVKECETHFSYVSIIDHSQAKLAAKQRAEELFSWGSVLEAYKKVILEHA